MEGLIIQGNFGTHLVLKCNLVKLTLRSHHTHWKVENTFGQLMSRSLCAALITHSHSKSVLKINWENAALACGEPSLFSR